MSRAAVRSVEFDGVRAVYAVDGALTTRPEIFFPDVPAENFAGALDPAGDMTMGVGGLLVELPDTTMLIDAGVGVLSTDFVFGHAECGTMPDVLHALGVGTGDIDVVAFTHLHFDHAGWAFVGGVKTFPHARYVLAAKEWAAYADREPEDGAAVAWHTVTGLAASGGDTEFVDDGAVVAPGVHALVTGGHTRGHTAYVVSSRTGRRLVAFGDAFHSPVQIGRPELLSAADADAAGVLSARRRLLTELTEPDTLGFGIHFGDQAFGRVRTTASGAQRWEPVPTTVLA
ncbi:MBL fold metallo-hydrolase [Mycobacterium sp. NAZ190054]|uniref:MBL fold metallo-hydrolase n=1 Tax=Mycobacterium sp. NAZ190054 TaxID=1747766 RepID=UPI000796D434|nr:MBL fold metallo-hydrolase [Mycobacterium sp. NAZ190054]KWX68506.1 MBL fold metallo-hydrolase [Mycobacterium sp. NAZ190054]